MTFIAEESHDTKSIEELASGLLVDAASGEPFVSENAPDSDEGAGTPDAGPDDGSSAANGTGDDIPLDDQIAEDYPEDEDEEPLEEQDEASLAESDTEQVDVEPADEQVSSPEADNYEVRVDGETLTVTLDELIRGYSGQAYITKQMNELGRVKSETEKAAAEMVQARNAYAQALQETVQAQSEFDNPEPDPALYHENPGEWARQRELWRTRNEQKQAQANELAELQRQQQQEHAQAHRAHVHQELETLKTHIPEFGDPAKAQVKRNEYAELAKNYGYDPREIDAVTDHRVFRILDRLHQLESAAKPVPQKKTRRKARSTTIRPGAAKRTVPAAQKRRNDQERKARETGRPEDVAALLIEPAGT